MCDIIRKWCFTHWAAVYHRGARWATAAPSHLTEAILAMREDFSCLPNSGKGPEEAGRPWTKTLLISAECRAVSKRHTKQWKGSELQRRAYKWQQRHNKWWQKENKIQRKNIQNMRNWVKVTKCLTNDKKVKQWDKEKWKQSQTKSYNKETKTYTKIITKRPKRLKWAQIWSKLTNTINAGNSCPVMPSWCS